MEEFVIYKGFGLLKMSKKCFEYFDLYGLKLDITVLNDFFLFFYSSSPEISDDDNSIAAIYQAVDELPSANRDTLAFLMIHLQRLAQVHGSHMH